MKTLIAAKNDKNNSALYAVGNTRAVFDRILPISAIVFSACIIAAMTVMFITAARAYKSCIKAQKKEIKRLAVLCRGRIE